jgi:hypothetical protein
MKRITKLFHKLTRLTRSLFPKSDELALSVNGIVNRFNLIEEAKKLGSLGLPPYHSKELSGVELEVVRYIELERARIQQDCLSNLEQLDACIAETQTHQFDLKTGLLTADFEREALVILNRQRSWLDKLATSAKNKLKELHTFKTTHQLSREASYPDGAALFFRYALLLLLVSFEGVFNATFFAEGLSTGLLGGFFYAVTLASINVFTAFILGKTAVRWCFHIQPALKAVGIAALIITLCLTAFNALAIGHLRNAILLESASPTVDALQSLLISPVGFNDLMAWVLFLVTIGFGIAAMVDGLFVDDLYPGYGDISRRAKAAVEEFEEEFEEVRAELEEIKQENMDALDAEIVKANQLLLRFAQQIEDKKAIYKFWTQKLNDSEVVLYATLRAFRSENTKHRNDSLLPAYFDTLPTLREVSIPKADVQSHEVEMQDMQINIKQIEASLPSRKAHIHQLFDSHIKQIDFLRQLNA